VTFRLNGIAAGRTPLLLLIAGLITIPVLRIGLASAALGHPGRWHLRLHQPDERLARRGGDGSDTSSTSLFDALQVRAAKQSAASSAGASSFCSPCA
jgi:hypothetical protein